MMFPCIDRRPRARIVHPSFAVRQSLLQGAAVVVAAWLTALLVTWPLAQHLTTMISAGTEHEATVPIFSLWNLWWTADRLPHAFAGYFNAPFFAPNQGVLTYSEPMPLIGVLVAPLWWVHAPPALIYNSALLGLLTLNGIFAYRVARALVIAPLPALLGSMPVVALPFVGKVGGVLPNVALFGMLWTLDGIIRYRAEPRWPSASWTALGVVATYLTFQQYALFFAPFALAAGLVALERHHFAARAIRPLAVTGTLALLAIGVLALPALRLHAELGFSRSDQVVQALSAHWSDLLTRPGTALLNAPPRAAGDTAGLFPGSFLLVLAAIGTLGGLRADSRVWTIFLATAAVCAVLLALGLNLRVGDWHPFATLRAIMPGLAEIRSPFRYAAIVQCMLALLAMRGLAAAGRRCGRYGVMVMVLLSLATVTDNVVRPGAFIPVPSSAASPWTSWLKQQPAGTVVAHIPFPPGLHVSDYEPEAWRMFAQIDHQQPIVNGYSGYFPQARGIDGQPIPTYSMFQLAMAHDFPNRELLCTLGQGIGAQLLVIDRSWFAGHAAQLTPYQTYLRPMFADSQVQIFALALPHDACTP